MGFWTGTGRAILPRGRPERQAARPSTGERATAKLGITKREDGMLSRLLALLFFAALAAPASAQDYPAKPIRIIVPFGPGGGGDIVGRIFGQYLQEKLGQSVVIENKPGAAGTLGNELVARAEKDGYTIGVMTAGQIIAAAMNKSLRYDTATAFEPISQV